MKPLIDETTRQAIISTLYPIPNPHNSQEEDLCFRHVDLLAMTDDELISELYCVEWRLHFGGTWHPWVVQRKERLNALIHAAKPRE